MRTVPGPAAPRGPSIQTIAFEASDRGDPPFNRRTRPFTEPAEPAARGPKTEVDRAKRIAPAAKTRVAMRVSIIAQSGRWQALGGRRWMRDEGSDRGYHRVMEESRVEIFGKDT
jgi:hypothetical protein